MTGKLWKTVLVSCAFLAAAVIWFYLHQILVDRKARSFCKLITVDSDIRSWKSRASTEGISSEIADDLSSGTFFVSFGLPAGHAGCTVSAVDGKVKKVDFGDFYY